MSINNVKTHPPILRPWDQPAKQQIDNNQEFMDTLRRTENISATGSQTGNSGIDPELVKTLAQYQLESLNMSMLNAFTGLFSGGPMMSPAFGGLANMSGLLQIFQMTQMNNLMSPWGQNPVTRPAPRVTHQAVSEESEKVEENKKVEETASSMSETDGSKEKPNKSEILNLIERVSKAHGLDPALVRAVVKTESNYDPSAVSNAGAMGLMQLMPQTAEDLGVKDPHDPVENVIGGVRYLKGLLDRYSGNVKKALAAYNWGPGNLEKYGGKGNMPQETRNYLRIVTDRYHKYRTETEA